jgi:hypothetical protein
MKRLVVMCMALSLAVAATVGCESKVKTERKETVSSPGGTTTTTDTHKVESSGDNPPANTGGETAK